MPPPASARTILVSMNPRAGSRCRRDRVQAIEAALAGAGFHVHTTTDLTELAALATEPAGRFNSPDVRAVVALGGDGTASVVRNQVPLAVPMLTVPMGTENLLGRYTRQSSDAADVLRTVENGVTIEVDLGRANGRYFLLMISAGFDAEVVRSLHENRSGNIRRTSYVLPTLKAVRSYRYPEMELYWEADETRGDLPLRCRWLFGFNFPMYGLGLSITPTAVATDGMLDLCAFERGTTWSIARYLWHVLRGGHQALSDTNTMHARRFRLTAADSSSIAYQLDGDHGGILPVEVDVLPGALRLLVSRETASRLGFAVPGEQ